MLLGVIESTYVFEGNSLCLLFGCLNSLHFMIEDCLIILHVCFTYFSHRFALYSTVFIYYLFEGWNLACFKRA